jgi:hypothetical protein
MSIDRRTLIKFTGIASASASTTVAFGSNVSSAAPVSTRKLFEEVKLGTLTLTN